MKFNQILSKHDQKDANSAINFGTIHYCGFSGVFKKAIELKFFFQITDFN